SGPGDAYALVAARARDMSDAEVAAVAVPGEDPKTLRIATAVGEGYEELVELEFPVAETVTGSVFGTGESRVISNFDGAPEEAPVVSRLPGGPVFLVPLGSVEDVRGVLLVGKAEGRPVFPSAVMRLLEAFAGQA
ncbi:MAG: GAF domain-containing protein, partial [Actinobacteria bacterium]|nr:GAF domain-containing protein [Actinomycetota bacterium]NIU69651.1 GAF domain-containing protein [Actinomycetota bacterium]NIW31517.1 GAF domain-containing protein [Actinomycetota bacterium]